MKNNIYIYISVAAIVSLIIRALPLTLIRNQIRNKFIRSFLYYVPYVTLAVMTFPAITEATQNAWAGYAALAVGISLSLLGAGLLPVAAACCVVVFVIELIF